MRCEGFARSGQVAQSFRPDLRQVLPIYPGQTKLSRFVTRLCRCGTKRSERKARKVHASQARRMARQGPSLPPGAHGRGSPIPYPPLSGRWAPAVACKSRRRAGQGRLGRQARRAAEAKARQGAGTSPAQLEIHTFPAGQAEADRSPPSFPTPFLGWGFFLLTPRCSRGKRSHATHRRRESKVERTT